MKSWETYYKTVNNSGNLSPVSNELKAINKEFAEVEGIVKGYLNETSRLSGKNQTERLREEVSRQEEELSRIEQEIERTYAACKRGARCVVENMAFGLVKASKNDSAKAMESGYRTQIMLSLFG